MKRPPMTCCDTTAKILLVIFNCIFWVREPVLVGLHQIMYQVGLVHMNGSVNMVF